MIRKQLIIHMTMERLLINLITTFVALLLLGIGCGNEGNIKTAKYFGDFTYLNQVDSINSTDRNLEWSTIKFEIADFQTQTLDSIIDGDMIKNPRDQKQFIQSALNLYRVLENNDTLCYRVGFSTSSYASIEIYSNCEVGFLLKSFRSIELYDYFEQYFQKNYKIEVVSKIP